MKTLLTAFALLSFAAFGHCAEVTWTGTTDGNWEEASNWSPSTPPGAGDTAVIGAVETLNTTLELTQPAYSLYGMDFRSGGYLVLGDPGTAVTLTSGTLSSQASDFSMNFVAATVSLTAAANTISVLGTDHELDLDDLNVSGSLTTHVEGFLCLGGVTTVSGGFVKTGGGETCTGTGMTATSASIEDGLFTVEYDSSLGNVAIETLGNMLIDYGSTVTAGTVRTSGLLLVSGYFGDQGSLTATGGVTVEDEGVLGGAGDILGDVTVEAGGAIEAGALADPEAMLDIVGNVTLEADSILRVDILDSTTLFGSISIEGDLAVDGLLCVCNSGAEGLFTLVEFTGSLTGSFTDIINTLPEYEYELIYNTNSIQLQVTAIPEPSTVALAVAGGLIFLRRRRA